MQAEKIYEVLPETIQNIAISVQGQYLKWRRYGKKYDAVLEEISTLPWFEKELRSKQEQYFTKFKESISQSIYWREKLKPLGYDFNLPLYNQLQMVPISSKQEIKENAALISPRNIDHNEIIVAHTSGTTGGGLNFVVSHFAEIIQWAIWWRYRGWHGITQDVWCGYFGGRSVVPVYQSAGHFYRINYPGKQVMFSNYHLTKENLKSYLEGLARYNISWIHGYPSNIALLASLILEQVPNYKNNIKIVTTGAESLLEHQKKLIERVFECKVRQHYGLAEGVANISECPNGNLHVDESFAYVEFIPLFEKKYRIIGTNFHNSAFPLLRYDTGDIAEIDPNMTCQCGRNGRLVKSIDGRREDYIVLKNGSMVGRIDHAFKDMSEIKEAQIRQAVPGEITVLVVKMPNYTHDTEMKLRKNLESRLGGVKINFKYVKNIEKTSAGKLRFVVSEISSAKIGDFDSNIDNVENRHQILAT